MPRVRLPESDEGRLQLLNKTLETAAVDANAGRYYLPESLATEVSTFLTDQTDPNTGEPVPGYRVRVQQLIAKRAATSKEVEDADKAEAVLETYIRDFWEVLKRRTFRLGHSVAVLNHYDLPQDGSLPVLSTRADRQTWAGKIRDGEPAAAAAGFPAMANPSARR